MENKITVYTSSFCSVCLMVKDFLITSDVLFEEVNVDLHPIKRAKLIGATKKLTVPQTNINGVWISGYDPVAFLKEMQVREN
ncbi:glutaredoxin family protein [Oceanobacillus sp. CAU 1775]